MTILAFLCGIKWLLLYNGITLLLESSVHNSIGLHSSL